MPKVLSPMNWALIRKHAWYEGVIFILLLPVALPISFWYFQTVIPVHLDLTVGGWDAFGQVLLASLVGLVATISGFAIDIGLVRIATGAPTHSNRWMSLTFWVPLVFCTATCIITFDYYSNHTWEVRPSTLSHLAYPIASFIASLYWSWSRDWVAEITAPFRVEIESLTIQIESWNDRFSLRVDQATQELSTRITELIGQLSHEKERSTLFEQRGKEVGAILEQVGDANAQMIAELRTQFQKTLTEQQEFWETQAESKIAEIRQGAVEQYKIDHAEIDRLGDKVREVQAAAARQKARDQESIDDLTRQMHQLSVEVGGLNQQSTSFKYVTATEGIRDLLDQNPAMTTDQLAKELNVQPDQLKTFRTQVSQVKRGSVESSMAA